MRFLRRNKKNDSDIQPLVLTGVDGETWIEFPGPVVDAVRQTITRLMRTDPLPEKLVITSAVRQEGVTYLSKAIGMVLANDMNRKVCVVELNWWWPSELPKSVSGRPGLADALSGDVSLEEIQMATGMENLTIIPAGKLANKRRSTLSHSVELAEMIDRLAETFDNIILDIPAVTAASDSIHLASNGNGLCLVVRQGVTSVQRVRAALDDLAHLNILGVVMNQVNVATPSFLLDYIVQE